MSKKSSRKGTALTQEEKDLGKKRIYIIVGMIVVGLAIAMYSMN